MRRWLLASGLALLLSDASLSLLPIGLPATQGLARENGSIYVPDPRQPTLTGTVPFDLTWRSPGPAPPSNAVLEIIVYTCDAPFNGTNGPGRARGSARS